MNVYEKNNVVILEGVADFDPKHIFECGQCFRWMAEEDGSYTGVAKGKVINVSRENDTVYIKNSSLKDFNDMKASEVSVKMMQEEASNRKEPLTQNFIRTLHHTLLREDYTEYRTLPNGVQTSFVIHAGQYKTRPNSVITRYGDRFEYASPEETPALMSDLVDWYNGEEERGGS